MAVPWLITITRSATCSMSATSWKVRKMGGSGLGVDPHQELAEALLGQQVEPDGRLVEEEDGGLVEHARHQLAAHPLAEREVADRDVEQLGGIEQLGQLASRRVACRRRSRRWIAASMRRDWRGVSSNHSCERWPKRVPIRVVRRRRSRYGTRPRTRALPAEGGVSGHDLDRLRLPGTVGADVGDLLTGVDRKGEGTDGVYPVAPRLRRRRRTAHTRVVPSRSSRVASA